ncbi:MAG TPA: hypothetical protein VHM19_09830, partial [Polyangiales bacterium]|nr:hypothetical protein [Polyangiales bacterium]
MGGVFARARSTATATAPAPRLLIGIAGALGAWAAGVLSAGLLPPITPARGLGCALLPDRFAR